MASINIFGPDTAGVDAKSNPLFLGNKKLRMATGFAFSEGEMRSRPGFRYHRLGVSGRFQGVCAFTPSMGISAQSFADALSGIVTAAGGRIFVNDTTNGSISCSPIEILTEKPVSNIGDVNVFGAENWLIIQNRNSETHWWSGVGTATASPGMSDRCQWDDAPVAAVCFTPVKPVANIPDCDRFSCDPEAGCVLTLEEQIVVNSNVATFRIKNTGFTSAEVTGFYTTPLGKATFDPPAIIIPAGTSRTFVATATGFDFESGELSITIENTCGVGTFTFELAPPDTACGLEVLSMTTTSPTICDIVLKNTGSVQVRDIFISPTDAVDWTYSPAPPWVLEPGEVINIQINGNGAALSGKEFSVVSSCPPPPVDPPPKPVVPPVVGGGCSVEAIAEPGERSGSFTVINNGGVLVSILNVSSANMDIVFDLPTFPYNMTPGSSITLAYVSASDTSTVGSTIVIDNTCFPGLSISV